jgi:hypothetical protein
MPQTRWLKIMSSLPDDHPLNPTEVKKWIAAQTQYLADERRKKRHGDKTANLSKHEAYIRNMKHYLRTGQWVDLLYGREQEHVSRFRCVALAYDKDGNPKRNVGTFYPDICEIWTREMQNG